MYQFNYTLQEKRSYVFSYVGTFCGYLLQKESSENFDYFLFKEDGYPQSSVIIKPYISSSSTNGIGKGVQETIAVINDSPLKFKYEPAE